MLSLRYNRLWLFFLAWVVALPLPVSALTPSDPFFNQWSYTDTGVYKAWDTTTGSRAVVVAVIDNGFDSWHPELQSNVWKNSREIPDNGIDDDHNGYIDDVYGWNFAAEDLNHNGVIEDEESGGNNNPRPSVLSLAPSEKEVVNHGTAVAGIIGAVGNNEEAGAGIAWQVTLMNLKIVGNSGTGELTRLPDAIHYAVDNGADIINMSFVGSVDGSVKDAVKYAHDHGVVVVAAAGNDLVSLNKVPRYPVCADVGESEQWILGVSAITPTHHIAPFSNTGSDCVDITAPGVSVSSTLRYAPSYGLSNEYGGGWSGTSFAAPFVSGAAALIKSIHPEWHAPEIYHAILSTVHRTPPKDDAEYANLFGAGLIQIDQAVAFAASQPRVDTYPLRALVAVAPAMGSVSQFDLVDKTSVVTAHPELKNISDAAVFRDNGQLRFATVAPAGKSKNEVVIYSDQWAVLGRWQLSVAGAMRIIVGNVLGDSAPEIIVAPASPSSLVYQVYSVAGEKLREVVGRGKHTGVSLALARDSGTSKLQVLALYKDGATLKIHRYDEEQTLVTALSVPYTRGGAGITVGDLDGSGRQSYVITSAPGEPASVAYIAPDGTIERRFGGYSGYNGGIRATVGDYDSNGTDDVVLSPAAAGEPVKIWNGRVMELEEPSFFGENNLPASIILPIPKD